MQKRACPIIFCLTVLFFSCEENDKANKTNQKVIYELNRSEITEGDRTIALVGATLIDGTGAEPVTNASVIIENNTIIFAGKRDEAKTPDNAETIDVTGLTILPGLIDAHYHNGFNKTMPGIFLSRGITSVRDPGAWMDFYDSARISGKPVPRLFLTGPHIDMYPPAYPDNSYLVKDPEEGRLAVEQFVSQGATAVKVYFRLPITIIREICNTAHEHGLPVTGHLEITNARHAINAGLDGIEHVTSFGTCLLPPRDVEKYKQMVTADNEARNRGRYEAWNSIRFENNPMVDSLIGFLAHKKTFICPTLAVFERQADQGDSIQVSGFGNMVKFVGLANKGGARMVVGSHTWVPYADLGFAYFRELELFQEAGLETMEIIQAATLENARFLRIDERLGSIEAGKLADLILVEGNPLANIKDMRNVKRVMLNGKWIAE